MKRTLSLAVSLLLGTVITVTAQVPKLNSYPAASATIFLDFDGHTVNSVYWNGGVPFYATPYNFTAEQITTMFNMVAEDFRPFNLNITTDSTVYFAAPINRRQRIVITTNSSWYGSAGGVAYIGSFTWGLEIPGFVFSNLLNNNIKYVGEAISHETGHTLNLQHQSKYDAACNFLKEYNDGAGTGEISWAPIMGVGYYKNLTLWHRGSSSLGCSNIQDDIAIIAGTRNGFGFRSDDVADAYRNSLPLNMVNDSTFEVNGLLNSSADVDIYSFSLNDQGRFTLTAAPFSLNPSGNVNANIDSKIDILDNSGVVVASFNPANYLHAVVDTNLRAGTYYLRIGSTGNINTSNYGMLGSYKLKGTIGSASVTTTPPPPTVIQQPTTYTLSVNLSGTASGSTHVLNWSISGNDTVVTTTVEFSKDGATYSKLADVSAGVTSYSYNYSGKGTAYYRVVVKGISQKFYYSNTIGLRSTKTNIKSAGGSKVLNNTVQGQAWVTTEESVPWRLLDMNGRLINSGRFVNGINNINTQQLIPGVYLLQVIENGAITTHKLIKQ